ncbi:DNA repair helicase [Hygrophoropsis aurantiaca]|uniref:DNA repair helicase n=1 Tax=Hygrophoropsis aurantiaca TaxID=72124 RepID=A0ACB7ZVP5_9AGAM|nr:DNA repair helicase [Hygrophoropsis aurantiaca]
MESSNFSLPVPEQFPAFPYDPPYPIQSELMQHIYSSIEQRQVTIVESPTGTGKTLSLLCSSLTWLLDERERARKGKLIQQSPTTGPDWVVAQAVERRRRELDAEDQEYEEKLAKARKTEAQLRKLARTRVTKKPRTIGLDSLEDQPDDNIYLPDKEQDDEDRDDNFSPAVRALMAKMSNGSKPDSPQVDEPTCTKIYYASRTHSQLTQVLPELFKLKFQHYQQTSVGISNIVETPSGTKAVKRMLEDEDVENCEDRRIWRAVSLGSRKQLCINDDIKSRPGDLDEKCRQLMEGKTEKRCQYLPPMGEELRMIDFRDQILASPKDIEDLANAGRNAQTCPYYGSRKAIPQAEVGRDGSPFTSLHAGLIRTQLVTLPYNLLLQKTAREALGIDLTGQIVIIDEAHNLIPTMLSLSSVRLTFGILSISLLQVSAYFKKFRTRLSSTHALHLNRLIQFMSALQKFIADWKIARTTSKNMNATTEVFKVPDMIQQLGRKVEGINLLEIEGYLRRSKIARKISGYSDKIKEDEFAEGSKRQEQTSKGATPPLHTVEAFLLGLAGASEDGRLIFSLARDVEVKYQLLNPSTLFRDVVDVARSVVLAGGTMSPMSDVIAQLFPHLNHGRLSTFSCGHVVPKSHVQTLLLSRGPTGTELEFKHGRQSDRQLLNELGQLLANLCSVVPGGMVVFFPSYSYLNFANEVWTATELLQRLQTKKKVFWEPQDATTVETVLRDYNAAVQAAPNPPNKKAGAVLFAVVGAKLSEGLNFSDDLARAVVVIGLPFANKNSPELRERMQYANQLEAQKQVKRAAGTKDAASELYENMCMNAVNQSIGRAIRHRADWASLILVDRRFSSPSIKQKLPPWIRDGIVVCDTFGQSIKHLGSFIRTKKVKDLSA